MGTVKYHMNDVIEKRQNKPKDPVQTCKKREVLIVLPFLGYHSKHLTKQPSILKMKLQQHDIEFMETSGKKSESQMGFEPTTLRDLVGCSNHWATGDSMVNKGQFVVLD